MYCDLFIPPSPKKKTLRVSKRESKRETKRESKRETRRETKEGDNEGEKHKENDNSMHEKIHVSNRHMKQWKRAWWIRIDGGSNMRSARGRRRVWRAARRAAEQARDGDVVGETRQTAEEAEWKKWENNAGERQTKQCSENTLHIVQHLPATATAIPAGDCSDATTNDRLCVASVRAGEAQCLAWGDPFRRQAKCVWFDQDANDFVSQLLHSATGALLHKERATEVREEPALHPEPYRRHWWCKVAILSC